MRKYGIRDIKIPDIGNQPPIGSGVSSTAGLKSSHDIDAPAVGNILYIELPYVSNGTDLEDYSATTMVFKRDGTPITLHAEATQYVITQQDIGTLITCDYTRHEQGGFVQPTLVLSTGALVTGSAGWTLGELQVNFDSLIYPTENVYPIIQRHSTEEADSVYKLKSINGTGIDTVAPQAGNIAVFDAGTVYGSGAAKQRFVKGIASYNADTFSYFCRLKIPAATDNFFF